MYMLVLSIIGVIACFVYIQSLADDVILTPMIEDDPTDRYDDRYSKSIEIYAFQVIVRRYIKTGNRDALDKLLEWNTKYNDDPDLRTKYAIVQADVCFQHVLDIAEQTEQKPNFGIDLTYDYHELPITMQNNKHCNTEQLLKYVTELLED